MCWPKGWAGCFNGVELLSKDTSSSLSEHHILEYRSFSFRVEV